MTTLAEKLKVVLDKAIKKNEEEEKIRIEKKIKVDRDMIIEKMRESVEKGELFIELSYHKGNLLEPEVIMHLCKDDGFYIRRFWLSGDVYHYRIAVRPIWEIKQSSYEYYYGPDGEMYHDGSIDSWKKGVTFRKHRMVWDYDYVNKENFDYTICSKG